MKFSHLHVHTQYSLLDGAASIPKLYEKAIANGMPGLAISDHGNMYGVFDFVKEAYNNVDANGVPLVKPIVGCEFYITQDRTRKTFSKDEKDPRHHQILLAKNTTGYKNLIKLTSLGFAEGMYSKYPRIDKQLIHQYHEGLIATTCCLGALVPQLILKKGEEEAENEFKWWLNIFQDDYYVELQRHNMKEQDKVNEVLLRFAKKYNVKVIASNDTHYVEKDDYLTHDILLCINTGEKLSTPKWGEFGDDDVSIRNKRFAFPNDEFYLKSGQEMTDLFHDLPEAIDNTNEIIDKVELLNLKRDILLPFFEVPPPFKTQEEYLDHLTWSGAKKRYGIITPAAEERIQFELDVIRKMGFAGYFLIVQDFIIAGKDLGVFIGPGRGSAAGSAVAYCIGITNIDPIKYNLLFERFLNPERKSMPDIDTDFDDIGRQKVLDYVVNKYSKTQVAQIITYGTMAAKSSIADVARVKDLPLETSRMLTGLVPEGKPCTLKQIFHSEFETKKNQVSGEESLTLGKATILPHEKENILKLKSFYNGDDEISEILHQAEKLEGSVRNTGVHASAIIIAPSNLMDLIPVATSKDSDLFVTQIEGENIEEAGVIKMDFLGLKTLSVIKTALILIEENHGVKIEIDNIPLDDKKTFELYQAGDTTATFQFESPGMQKYLRDLKPDKFDDLIAMNALYRPGPIAYIPDFILRKHGQQEITYDLPELETYLGETYGITVYQEQVMLISQLLANFTKGDADLLRKAMGKKKADELAKMKAKFMDGATKNNHPKEKLEKIWRDWESFAEYAFNKSHSTCYAFIAYQTAYLKANYPEEFMAAALNHAGNMEKITFLMEDCKKMGIQVLGPHINESKEGFSVNEKKEVRFGLGSIAGVSSVAIDNILEERKKSGSFKDIFDFVKRVNLKSVNKKSIECFVYSGALDSFGLARALYFHSEGEGVNLEKIIRFGQAYQSQSTQSMHTLFGEQNMPEIPTPKIPECEPWDLITQLNHEKKVVGMYLSGHPLDNYRFEIQHLNVMPINAFNEARLDQQAQSNFKGATIRLTGYVVDGLIRTTKRGEPFGILVMEDYTGKMELAMFGDDYLKFNIYLQKGNILLLQGYFAPRRFDKNTFEFKIKSLHLLSEALRTMTQEVELFVNPNDVTEDMIDFLKINYDSNIGQTKFKITLVDNQMNLQTQLESSIGRKYEMNYDLINYLNNHPHIGVKLHFN